MARWSFYFGLIFVITISNVYGSPTLNKHMIQQFLNSLSVAAQNQNSQVLIKSLSPTAKITLKLPEDMGGVVVLNAKNYIKKLETTWALPADYHYEISDINIIIIGDATRAMVTDCVIESLSLDGEALISTLTKERIIIELVDGKPKITEIYAVVAQNLPN